MRLQVVEIGNSKGIRIPQAILKQVNFGEEVDLDVADGKIVLRRMRNQESVFGFETLAKMDDGSIKKMLQKVSITDVVTALIDAAKQTKEAIYRNLNEDVREYVKARVNRLEKGDAKELIIERSRNVISEAFLELLRG